jgi:hypothetical protein
LSQVLGVKKKLDNRAMFIGTMVHKAFEIQSKSGTLDGRKYLADQCREMWQKAVEEDASARDEDFEKNKVMMLAMYDNFPFSLCPHQVEFLVEMPTGIDYWTFKGKVDGRGIHPALNQQFLYDYKVKTRYDKILASRALQTNLQGLLYTTAYHDMTGERAYWKIIVIKKTELRQGKKEAFGKYLSRIKEDYSKNLDKNFKQASVEFDAERLRWMKEWLQALVWEIQEEDAWRMNPCACTGFEQGFTCDYYPYCYKELGWQRQYEEVGPDHHPELEEDDADQKTEHGD